VMGGIVDGSNIIRVRVEAVWWATVRAPLEVVLDVGASGRCQDTWCDP
jgi:hypothetical protein